MSRLCHLEILRFRQVNSEWEEPIGHNFIDFCEKRAISVKLSHKNKQLFLQFIGDSWNKWKCEMCQISCYTYMQGVDQNISIIQIIVKKSIKNK